MKILIADDHPAIRKTYELYLRSEGHQVITADSPEESFKSLQKNPFDLGIIDFDFGEMAKEFRNGIEVIIKARKSGVYTPIIVNTGYPGAAEDYIGKLPELEKTHLKRIRLHCKLTLEDLPDAMINAIKP